LIRRMPKRGFNNKRFGTRYLPVNLSDLNGFEEGSRVDESALRALGLATGVSDGIKILGTGDLTKRLTVSAHGFSASARAKIEALGGVCELIAKRGAVQEKA
jgi:large subunit ribosomal protein L15